MTGLFVFCYFGYLWSVKKEVIHKDDHHHDHGHGDRHKHHHLHNEHEEHSLDGHHHCCGGGMGVWELEDLSFVNTILPIPVLFITYDFFYTLLHWFLHVKAIYAFVHKHHHHQKAPSRANIDAVNVHPLEFFLGEFNHVLALHFVVRGMPLVEYHGMDVSWAGAALFIGMGGVLAGLNHTRYDVVVRIPSGSRDEEGKNCGWTLFDSKHHDVHHRIPQSNYGQYTVLWDRMFGTFREYNGGDRVNPAYQLDSATGMTLKSLKND
jgi:sterol desaturase/sphingolipid hydroxylase (fatty acid hydroxylase superfamily)